MAKTGSRQNDWANRHGMGGLFPGKNADSSGCIGWWVHPSGGKTGLFDLLLAKQGTE
jgi:hypothetical protein